MGLYPNIPHEEGLIVIRKALDTRKDKTISTDVLIELVECVLENKIFYLKSSFRSQDMEVFAMTFWSCRKNGWIRKIKFQNSCRQQLQYTYYPIPHEVKATIQ